MFFVFHGFCRFVYVLFQFHLQFEPMRRSVLKQKSDLNFNSVTNFMMTNVNVQDWGNFRIPTNPASRSSSLQGSVYSLHKCTIPFGASVLSVTKYCPLSTVFKPALEYSLDNFWSSDSRSPVPVHRSEDLRRLRSMPDACRRLRTLATVQHGSTEIQALMSAAARTRSFLQPWTNIREAHVTIRAMWDR